MTQIKVTIDDNSPVALIKKAISLLRGVRRAIVQKTPDDNATSDDELIGIPSNIRSLIGIASNIETEESYDAI